MGAVLKILLAAAPEIPALITAWKNALTAHPQLTDADLAAFLTSKEAAVQALFDADAAFVKADQAAHPTT